MQWGFNTTYIKGQAYIKVKLRAACVPMIIFMFLPTSQACCNLIISGYTMTSPLSFSARPCTYHGPLDRSVAMRNQINQRYLPRVLGQSQTYFMIMGRVITYVWKSKHEIVFTYRNHADPKKELYMYCSVKNTPEPWVFQNVNNPIMQIQRANCNHEQVKFYNQSLFCENRTH